MAMTDEEYMLRAVELAKKGTGWTNPNPLVGAVIVKGGRIIGTIRNMVDFTQREKHLPVQMRM